MISRRQQVREAARVRLGALVGVSLHVNRSLPIDEADVPAIELRTSNAVSQRFDKNGTFDHRFTLDLVFYAAGDDAADQADSLADQARVLLTTDDALAALLFSFDETEFDLADEVADQPFWGGGLAFACRYFDT